MIWRVEEEKNKYSMIVGFVNNSNWRLQQFLEKFQAISLTTVNIISLYLFLWVLFVPHWQYVIEQEMKGRKTWNSFIWM